MVEPTTKTAEAVQNNPADKVSQLTQEALEKLKGFVPYQEGNRGISTEDLTKKMSAESKQKNEAIVAELANDGRYHGYISSISRGDEAFYILLPDGQVRVYRTPPAANVYDVQKGLIQVGFTRHDFFVTDPDRNDPIAFGFTKDGSTNEHH